MKEILERIVEKQAQIDCLKSMITAFNFYSDTSASCLGYRYLVETKNTLQQELSSLQSLKEKEKKENIKCPDCNGFGKEICNNPDHGLISALSFHDIGRIGCPGCGHDEHHRMSTNCEKCNGTGFIESPAEPLRKELIKFWDYLDRLDPDTCLVDIDKLPSEIIDEYLTSNPK